MKRNRLLLLLIAAPLISFGQQDIQSFDYAMKRLIHKAWVMKVCDNGDCTIIDSNYYFFPTSLNDWGQLRDNNWEALHPKHCLQLINYRYTRDLETKEIKFGQVWCEPIICFCDSAMLKDTYTIFLTTRVGLLEKEC